MSVLRNLEDKIAGLVEGTFGRVFRTEVRPVELAHKLTREMDMHRTVSLSCTYVPHDYVVWLSPADRERYVGVEQEVIAELAGHMLEHARREQLVMTTSPQIAFRTDEALSLGEFGIQVLPMRDERAAPAPVRAPVAAPATPPPDAGTMVYSDAVRHREALERTRPGGAGHVLEVEGRRVVLPEGGATIGRSRDCEVALSGGNVSRHHAEIARTPNGGWSIRDLGSTNGLRVNGVEVGAEAVALTAGDRLEIGTVPARFQTA